MPNKLISVRIFIFAIAFFANSAVYAQVTSLVMNTTNVCVDSTYKFLSATVAAIDLRFNAMYMANTLCTVSSSNARICSINAGQNQLGATNSLPPTNPPVVCRFMCGTQCGTLIINGINDGLPVELLNFSIVNK